MFPEKLFFFQIFKFDFFNKMQKYILINKYQNFKLFKSGDVYNF